MTNAIEAVQKGMTQSKTHNITGVSMSISAGHPTVLTHDEEKETVATCQAMQDVGLA